MKEDAFNSILWTHFNPYTIGQSWLGQCKCWNSERESENESKRRSMSEHKSKRIIHNWSIDSLQGSLQRKSDRSNLISSFQLNPVKWRSLTMIHSYFSFRSFCFSGHKNRVQLFPFSLLHFFYSLSLSLHPESHFLFHFKLVNINFSQFYRHLIFMRTCKIYGHFWITSPWKHSWI